MKLRSGFVSNSSSNSFIILDRSITEKDIAYKMDIIQEMYMKLTGDTFEYNVVKQTKENLLEELYRFNEKSDTYISNMIRRVDTPENILSIVDVEDNGIPSDLFDLIEGVFNAERMHWG
jgi:hypothetical protein